MILLSKQSQRERPMETFAKLFGSLLALVYHCFDRLVILGHLPLLTRPENISTSFATSTRWRPSARKSCVSEPTITTVGWKLLPRNVRSPWSGPRKASAKKTTSVPTCDEWSAGIRSGSTSSWNLRLPRPEAYLRPQPEGKVHTAREDDREKVPQGAKGDRRLVQAAPARPCGGAAEDPQRQAPRSLPVLRAPHELPQSMAVLPEGPTYLAWVAESPYTGKAADVGSIYGNPTPLSAVATSDHTLLGGRGESRLKNPLQKICTAGSVRGEIPGGPWWTYPGTKLETADTAKEHLPLTGAPLLGVALWSLGIPFSHVKHLIISMHVAALEQAPSRCQPRIYPAILSTLSPRTWPIGIEIVIPRPRPRPLMDKSAAPLTEFA